MSVIINRQRVAYRGRAFKVVTENITLPNGVTTELDVLKHPGASAIVAMSDPETVVLLRQYRHAVQSHIWEIPAGTLDPGELPLDCAKRELTEETGFSANRWEKLGEIIPVPGYSDERIHLYLASGLETGAQQLDEGEWLEVHRVAVSDAMEMIRAGKIQDGKTITGLLLAQQAPGRRSAT
jgi:ADP-ribose pyrophosphatase